MIRNPVVVGEPDEPTPPYTPPPAIGEHTREVLAMDLGWDDASIDEFLRE